MHLSVASNSISSFFPLSSKIISCKTYFIFLVLDRGHHISWRVFEWAGWSHLNQCLLHLHMDRVTRVIYQTLWRTCNVTLCRYGTMFQIPFFVVTCSFIRRHAMHLMLVNECANNLKAPYAKARLKQLCFIALYIARVSLLRHLQNTKRHVR